jgi:2'-5' RNA ligase/GNAT superfamily N-acetyltransferase
MEIEYRLNPPLTNTELDRLYAAAWPNHQSPWDFGPELLHLLAFVCAYVDGELVGCVKLAWDGAVHAFLLEPTVHPTLRRRGIGRGIVKHALEVARANRLEWVHVDYEPRLSDFYRACGFEPTAAGLIRLDRPVNEAPARTAAPRRAIVVFPDLGDLQPILPFRARWDPLAEHVPPHLTLVFPFSDPLSPTDLRRHVATAIQGIEPFTIRLSDVTGAEGEYLFVNVKRGNDVLVALHDRVYAGALEHHRSLAHTFVPHLTVGRVVDRRGFAAALDEASALRVNIDTHVRALSIYAIEPDGSGHIEAEVALRA